MKIHHRPDPELPDTVVVSPEGRLDALGSGEFWNQVEPVFGDGTSVLLDLSQVAFMSSAGVGTLIRVVTRVQQLSGKLVAYGASSRVKAVLQVVSLEPVLNLCADENAARERLRELQSG